MISKSSKEILVENLNSIIVGGGLSARRLALICDVSDRSVGKIINDNTSPTLDYLDKIASGLEVQPSQLITEGMMVVNKGAVSLSECEAKMVARLLEDFLTASVEGKKQLLALASSIHLEK